MELPTHQAFAAGEEQTSGRNRGCVGVLLSRPLYGLLQKYISCQNTDLVSSCIAQYKEARRHLGYQFGPRESFINTSLLRVKHFHCFPRVLGCATAYSGGGPIVYHVSHGHHQQQQLLVTGTVRSCRYITVSSHTVAIFGKASPLPPHYSPAAGGTHGCRRSDDARRRCTEPCAQKGSGWQQTTNQRNEETQTNKQRKMKSINVS